MDTRFETGGAGSVANTHDWLTPPEIIEAIGPFDLDPCASLHQPWRTAAKQYTIEDDGLKQPWHGRVWCNPPYGPFATPFLQRLAAHGDGVTLTFARTETKVFQAHVWPHASAVLFLAGRLRFRLPGGGHSGPAGAPSVLIAYGDECADLLQSSGLRGFFVRTKERAHA